MKWDELKREYITTNISYRKLSAKYDVPFGTLKRNAIEGKWVELREQYRNKVDTKSLAKAEAEATDYKTFLYGLAFKVAAQLNDMTEQYTVSELIKLGLKPRDITGAIKDLEDSLHIKSESDLREQEARIKKLRKETEEKDESSYMVRVEIGSVAEEYAK